MLLVMTADLSAIAAGLGFAYWLRFHSGLIEVTKGYNVRDYLRILPWACFFWFLSLRFENLYRRHSRILDFNVIRRIVTGSVLALMIFFTFAFYERAEPQYSRVLIPIVFGSVIVSLVAERIVLHVLFQELMLRWRVGLTRTLILGGGEIATKVFETLKRHPEHGMAPVGALVDRNSKSGGESGAVLPILGAIDDLETILERERIDEVILAQPELDRARIPTLLIQCERQLAEFHIVPDTTELLFSGMVVETFRGIPFLGVHETPLRGWNAALKRLVDFLAALVGLIVLSPVMLVVGWLIRRHDGGPALYVQERMGLDRRRFTIYKFRTMRVDAEAETGPIFAEENDPRCTALGLRLRKYRLDELPQLVNVLKGEMSLVGPRPERPYFVEQFRDDIPRYMARHKVKSGITGWAQIHGLCGKHGSIPQRLKYDLYYIENWSWWLDFKILWLTLFRSVSSG